MTENYITGKLYRVLSNVANDVWDRLSFWKKASDVEFNDKSNLENNRPPAILKRNTTYSVGEIAYISVAPSWAMFVCTTQGKTATKTPTIYSTVASPGVTITDGTAKFAVYDKRLYSTFANNTFIIPSMGLAYDINGQLTADGKKFNFAYQNGAYGYTLNGDSSTFESF